jgi:uncharacterized protein (DUF427 family)
MKRLKYGSMSYDGVAYGHLSRSIEGAFWAYESSCQTLQQIKAHFTLRSQERVQLKIEHFYWLNVQN